MKHAFIVSSIKTLKMHIDMSTRWTIAQALPKPEEHFTRVDVESPRYQGIRIELGFWISAMEV